jgi:hypothetical protein
MTASRIATVPGHTRTQARVDAGGTAWRLRSLIAMGHDCARIGRALQVHPEVVRRIVAGQSQSATPELRGRVRELWEAWWSKTPPRRTAAERRAAAMALRQAERNNWPAAAGLDEDLLDEPGYRPWSHYRPAIGTGEAAPFPAGNTTTQRRAARRVTTRPSRNLARKATRAS